MAGVIFFIQNIVRYDLLVFTQAIKAISDKDFYYLFQIIFAEFQMLRRIWMQAPMK